MNTKAHPGVYAAVLTPLTADLSPDLESIPILLDFLAKRGCHGALLLGTTGEGPSFAPPQREQIFRAALHVRQQHSDFQILAGTGTPSLDETVQLTRLAFDLGLDGVVVLPPYYYRQAGDDGLYAWFSHVLQRGVPSGGPLLGYHIPPVSGVPLSIELLKRLKEDFPDRFAGIKDSSSNPEHAVLLGETFGDDLFVLNGNDRLFSLALQNHASGCITALANLKSPDLRRIWDAYQQADDKNGEFDAAAQERLDAGRGVVDRYPPAAPLLKALISRLYDFPCWPVLPPLTPMKPEDVDKALDEFVAVG